MINVKEHIYDDDPDRGHPDVRTRLKGASYFFLGNGSIQAAVQFSPEGEGTPVGLIITDPERLVPKRKALNFNPQAGFEETKIRLRRLEDGVEFEAKDYSAGWLIEQTIPIVGVQWRSDAIRVEERFYCPDPAAARLVRSVRIENITDSTLQLEMTTGVRQKSVRMEVELEVRGERLVYIQYAFHPGDGTVDIELLREKPSLSAAEDYWAQRVDLSFGSALLDRFFRASAHQLAAVISNTGKVDASIWQYNREWVRDHAFMAVGLTLAGHHEKAGTLLERLFREFVTDDGDCIDSSERRDPEEVELDQNGTLLYALKQYVLWSGDADLVVRNWDKIKATADFPLKDMFRHEPSGMLVNRREYWERHGAHGIEPGIELMYQVFPSIGLDAASYLARVLGKHDEARRWEDEAARLKKAVLEHPEYALVDERGFIKRRSVEGPVQEVITPRRDSGLPAGVPLAADFEHYLNPDSCAALPIALGFVAPDSPVSKATMASLEALWNQDWEGGGYGRYHFSSEPDSSGPWPFPSLFMARAYLEMGEVDKVRWILEWLDAIPGAASGAWFETYCDRIAPPYAQVGVTPWTWAEMITLLVHHMIGIQPQENHIRFRPKLLPGLDSIRGSLPLRNFRVNLNLRVEPGVISPAFHTDVYSYEVEEGEIHIPYPDDDFQIEAILPHDHSVSL